MRFQSAIRISPSAILKSIEREVSKVVRSRNWGGRTSPAVPSFEKAFARKMGMPHAVSANSGTSALCAALVGVGVRNGDEVLVPTLSVPRVGDAVLASGGLPVPVDVDPLTWNMDPADAAQKITRRTKVMVMVHLFGVPCDIGALLRLAGRHRLKVVDDAAQALWARYKGRLVGTFGDAGVFSFEHVKHVSTGEGGMGVFRSTLAAKRARVAVQKGFRMTAFQAAAGSAQLPFIETLVSERIRRALAFREKLAQNSWVVPQFVSSDAEAAFFRVGVVISPSRILRGSRKWFPPLHLDRRYDPTGRGRRSCPVADDLAGRLRVV